MKEFKYIGTVEILQARTYPIDPTNKLNTATEACVVPGSFPLLSDGYTYVWLMTGKLNGNFMRRGDGLFLASGFDLPIDNLVVTFPSPSFGPQDWEELLDHPICHEGDPEQRLRITILKEN